MLISNYKDALSLVSVGSKEAEEIEEKRIPDCEVFFKVGSGTYSKENCLGCRTMYKEAPPCENNWLLGHEVKELNNGKL